ncbi:testis-expressed protein 13D-like isoform X2 [Zalophus californianus]|uniref:Testis-expressed protein 13D-like isoform X2 n=1 Tax=Zalophus californianus TaxID=9704 RepID=A0A6P9EZS0_ZALCA|nr:testis-expressed protein 13D-like isoform X2 [Zalophus californianus]
MGQGGHLASWHQGLKPPLSPPFHLAPGHVPHRPLKEPAGHLPWTPPGPPTGQPSGLTLLAPSLTHTKTPGPWSTKAPATEERPQVPPSRRGGWLPTMQGRCLGQSAHKQHWGEGSPSSRSLPVLREEKQGTDGGQGHAPSHGRGQQALADTHWKRKVAGVKVAVPHDTSVCGSGRAHRPAGALPGPSISFGDQQLQGAHSAHGE